MSNNVLQSMITANCCICYLPVKFNQFFYNITVVEFLISQLCGFTFQAVTFRVDAYPTETFNGTVKQVRLNPTTVQNVVTYSTVIDVPNPDLKLKPGMTANVTIEVAHRENVLRIPNAALRFRPTADIFAALHQPVPPELERGFNRGNRGNGQRNAAGQPGAPGAAPPGASPSTGSGQAPSTGSAQAPGAGSAGRGPSTGSGQAPAQSGANAGQGRQPRGENQGQTARNDQSGQRQPGQGGQGFGGGQGQGGGRFANMTPEERQKAMEERQKAMEERLKNMTPEERAAFEERRRQFQAQGGGRGGSGGGQGFGGGRGGSGQGGQNASNQRGSREGGSTRGQFQGQVASNNKGGGIASTSATTIDALFAPIQMQETSGRAWLYINKQLKSVALRLGISDGTYTEVLNEPGELQPNTEVVTAVITPEMASRPANQQQQNSQPNNPFNPQRGRPGGPGGGGGGRGGGR